MDILVIGGTRFVGRHLVGELLRRDHDLTLFHRGETNVDLFPRAERILGDRTTDLDTLGDRTWDFVIDTCGYTPEHVELSTEYLGGRTDRYVFISSAAVYEPSTEPGIDESSPVQSQPPSSDTVEWWHTEYARNKVECEAIVLDTFGESEALIIRPGMVMGPYDPVNFFTYWVLRMYRGGDVIAPPIGDQPLQFIDARDLAAFTADMVDRSIGDVFTVDGPADPLTVRSFLELLRDRYGGGATLHWLEEDWLAARDLSPPWEKLPYWLPGEAAHGYCRMDNSKAIDHGLTFRPTTESADDVLDWYEQEGLAEHQEWTHGLPPNRGLSPEKEAEILENYFEEQEAEGSV